MHCELESIELETRNGLLNEVITLRNHAPRSYITGLSVTVSVLDLIIV